MSVAPARKAVAVDMAQLQSIEQRARATAADALAIWHAGEMLVQWPPPDEQRPIETMSATKSIVSMLAGLVVADGHLELETPVSTFFPEWKKPRYESITVRHLLEHTSGLATAESSEIYAQDDIVAFALQRPLAAPPGGIMQYNNLAAHLIPTLLERAIREPLRDYAQRRLFQPLGIELGEWAEDARGHLHGAAGISLRAADLVKLGRLMLDGGVWQGKRILPQTWVDESTAGSRAKAEYGLQWWRLGDAKECLLDAHMFEQWRALGVDEELLALVKAQEGLNLHDDTQRAALREALGGGDVAQERLQILSGRGAYPPCHVTQFESRGFYADGWLGQYIVVIPELELVAVRQQAYREGIEKAGLDHFTDFPRRVAQLVPQPSS